MEITLTQVRIDSKQLTTNILKKLLSAGDNISLFTNELNLKKEFELMGTLYCRRITPRYYNNEQYVLVKNLETNHYFLSVVPGIGFVYSGLPSFNYIINLYKTVEECRNNFLQIYARFVEQGSDILTFTEFDNFSNHTANEYTFNIISFFRNPKDYAEQYIYLLDDILNNNKEKYNTYIMYKDNFEKGIKYINSLPQLI